MAADCAMLARGSQTLRQVGSQKTIGCVRMDVRAISTGIRAAMIFGATVGAVFWLLFALDQFPWIVPPDHSRSIVSAYEKASVAGVCLFFMSIGTICLVAGFFGNRWGLRILALVLSACWLAVFPRLFPHVNVLEYPARSTFYVLGLVFILAGAFFAADRIGNQTVS